MFSLRNVHIELTTKCFLKCPRCPRTMRKISFKPAEISLDQFQRVFTTEVLLNQVQKLIFCGSLGDPIYCKDFLEIYRYTKNVNPKIFITTVTNGGHKEASWWEELKKIVTPGDEIIFSVDGFDKESNGQYRVNNNWKSFLGAVEVMAGGPAMLQWAMILFKFNQDHVEEIRDQAERLGFDRFCVNRSSQFGSYHPEWIDKSLGFDPLEPSFENSADSIRYGKKLTWLRQPNDKRRQLFTSAREDYKAYLSEKIALAKAQFVDAPILPACVQGERAVYIDASLNLSPCCWSTHGAMGQLPGDFFFRHREAFQLKEVSLEQVLSYEQWGDLERGWLGENNNVPKVCVKKCSKGT